MTTDTKHTIFYTLLFAGVVAGLYFGYKWAKGQGGGNTSGASGTPTKEDMVMYIVSFSGGQGSYTALYTLDDAYIAAWYNAVKNKQSTFTIGGGKFDSVSGKATA